LLRCQNLRFHYGRGKNFLNGFETFSDFLLYSGGAAVSPGSVFMHLCGVRKTGDCYVQPSFDVLEAARPIAIFSYMVHIVRDFQKDQLEKLDYFAEDLMVENGVTVVMLRQIAAGGEIGPGFRSLMRKYHELTEYHRCKARQSVDNLKSCLEPRYHLSLEVLYSLYLQIFERINVEKGQFTTDELNPLPDEVRERIELVLSSFESC